MIVYIFNPESEINIKISGTLLEGTAKSNRQKVKRVV